MSSRRRSASTSVVWHRDDQGTIVLVRLPWRRNSAIAALLGVLWVAGLWQLGYAHAYPAVGIALCVPALAAFYVAAVGWLNRWVVNLDPEMVVVRMRPLPWRSGTSLATSQVSALGLDKTFEGAGRQSTYTVEAKLQDGRKQPLITGLRKPAAVRTLDVLTSNFPRSAPDTGKA